MLLAPLGCAATASGGLLTHAPAATGAKLEPPAPPDLYWVKFTGAEIPDKSPGGQLWDDVDELPDPFAVIYVDDREVLRGSTEGNTLSPTWPEGPSGNILLPRGSSFKLELFDADALENTLIGRGKFVAPTTDELNEGFMWIQLEAASGGGARARRGRVKLSIEAPHALIGFGFGIEVDREKVFVTECLEHSPAGRAGVRKGDKLLAVNGVNIAPATESEGRSFFDGATSVDVTLKHPNGPTQTIKLKQGAVYPLFDEYGVLP